MTVDGKETSGWDITRWVFFFQKPKTSDNNFGRFSETSTGAEIRFFSSPTVSPTHSFGGASLGFNRQPKQMVVEDVSLLGEVWLDRNRWFMISLSENFAQKYSKKCPEVFGLPWCKKTVATPHFQSGWFVYIVFFFLTSSWGRSFLDFNFWAKKFLYTPWN